MNTKSSKAVLTILFLVVISLGWSVLTDYTFSSSTGAYTEITDATTHGTSANDNEVFNDIPIGFDFNYNATVYTSVSIAANGFIAMGQSVVTSNTPLSAGTSNNVIAPFSRDLKSRSDGVLASSLSGTAPNRVFTIQWYNYRRYVTSAVNDTLNFQIKLYETTNSITFNYGYVRALTVVTAATVQCGLRGAANTEFLNRMTTTDWAATTTGVANNSNCAINSTVFPANGLIFNWAPALIIVEPNPAEIVYPLNASENVALNSNLHWNSGGGVVTGYKVFLGTDNPPTNISNGVLQTTTIYDPTSNFAYQTVYYWKIVPTNDVGDAFNCPVWSFTSMPDPTVTSFPYSQNWDAETAPAVAPSWTVLNANNDNFTWITVTTGANSEPNALRCSYNTSSAIPMDDWAISPPLQLAAGAFYKIQFYYKAYNATLPEKLEIKYGTSNDIAALTNQIYLNSNITNTTYVMAETYLPPTAGGIHYFGFHGFSDANMYYLYIDNINVTEVIPVFNPPVNLTAVFGTSSVALAWQAPVSSVPVGYKVFRDGVQLNANLITARTYTDNSATAGVHSYYVTAKYLNPPGESVPSNTVTDELRRTVTNLQCNVIQDDVYLTWVAPVTANRFRDLTGFKVYRDGEFLSQIFNTSDTSYVDLDLPNSSYIYEVSAVYTSGESAPGPFVVADVNVPVVPTIFTDSFDNYPNFALAFGSWILSDLDNSATITFNDIDFLHEGSPQAFTIFNPSATTPPSANILTHTGQKMAACIAATNAPNNDWMITTIMRLGTENSITLWVKSASNLNGLERFKVGLSTADNALPQTFTMLSGESYVEAPLEWTRFTYQVPVDYNAELVRFGILCESANGSLFLVDDVKVQGYNGVAVGEVTIPVTETALLGNYPNPFNAQTLISYDVKDDAQVSLQIFNLKGQLIRTLVNGRVKAGNYNLIWKGDDENRHPVSSGVYVYKFTTGRYSSTHKMILLK